MYRYTLGFIKRKNEILLVNRQKAPWLGSWNGLGGKRLKDESPVDCILREIHEETDITVSKDQVKARGYLTWNTFDSLGKGLYLFLIEVADDFSYPTPIQTPEGILDWKTIDWVMDPDNYGVAHNMPYFIKYDCN
ncbi:MAG: NUDIX hydrolase [Acholeplasmataceae bacterium]